jgi:putative transposase
MVSPSDKSIAAGYLEGEHDFSERQACQLVSLPRSTHRYEHIRKPEENVLREQIRALATQNKRFGYPRIHALLEREYGVVNIKRVHRIWKDEGLQLPRRRPRKRNTGPTGEVFHKATHKNHVWSWDFVFDATEKGGALKCLTVIDEYTRESLEISVSNRIGSQKVISIIDQLFLSRGTPDFIRSDNGPEFVAKAIHKWLKKRGSKAMYIKPGSPWENPYIESFNGKFRDECLNMHIFRNISDAQWIISQWRNLYNYYRPHSSLNYQTPTQFAALCTPNDLNLEDLMAYMPIKDFLPAKTTVFKLLGGN